MTYGDGSGNAHPLTSIDVAAHEMSHGVTENTAGLIYSGEPAASTRRPRTSSAPRSSSTPTTPPTPVTTSSARRSTSTATAPRCATWTSRPRTARPRTAGPRAIGIGRPALLLRPAEPLVLPGLRGHAAPRSINGVAYNSPTCDGSTVTGIGRDKAAKIWYRTLTTKLTSTSTYAAARNGAIRPPRSCTAPVEPECTRHRERASRHLRAGRHGSLRRHHPAAHRQQPAAQPGLRVGRPVWTGTAGPITNNTGRPARTGSWKLWLRQRPAGTETISQSVAIPASATTATLSFWIRIDTAETDLHGYDTMRSRSSTVRHRLPRWRTYSNLRQERHLHPEDLQRHGLQGQATVKFHPVQRGLLPADVLRHRRHLRRDELTQHHRRMPPLPRVGRHPPRRADRNVRSSRAGAPAPPPLTCRGPPRRPRQGSPMSKRHLTGAALAIAVAAAAATVAGRFRSLRRARGQRRPQGRRAVRRRVHRQGTGPAGRPVARRAQRAHRPGRHPSRAVRPHARRPAGRRG